jgi:ABC-type transport system substrate-binding protein
MRRLACSTVIVAAVALSACRSDTSTQKAAHVDKVPPPEEPLVMTTGDVGPYGGRFVQAAVGTPSSFNFLATTTSAANEIINQLFTTLVRFDGVKQDEVPRLATSWDVSGDGRSWTFHLRHGARFSDGHPITADDVLFTFSAIYDPHTAHVIKAVLSSQGQTWEVVAPNPIYRDHPNVGACRLNALVGVNDPHSAEARAGTPAARRHVQFRVQRQYIARRTRHQRPLAAENVRGQRTHGAHT